MGGRIESRPLPEPLRNEHAVEIARQPEAVFPYLTEPERLLRWVGGLREFVPADDGEAQVGSRSRQRMRIAGHDWTFEGAVVELDPDERIVVCIRGRGLRMTSTYLLQRNGEGTRLTVGVESEFTRVFARLLRGIVDREGQRKLEADLGRLATLVERETPS
jgi:uncharacterized protein YndB with AHSA1/START domain